MSPISPIENIGNNVFHLRKELRLSQAQLAVQVGVPTAVIGHVEAGRSQPAPEAMERLAFSLGVTVADLTAPPPNPAVGQLIWRARQAKDWNQEELGAIVGVSAQRIARVEAGLVAPGPALLGLLQEALKMVFDVSAEHEASLVMEAAVTPGERAPENDEGGIQQRDRKSPRYTALAANLRRLRKKIGWTQNELGDRLGITGVAVSQYESGKARPSLEKQVQMSELLGEEIAPGTAKAAFKALAEPVAQLLEPYIVVQASTGPELAQQVNGYLQKGYLLRGPMLVTTEMVEGQDKLVVLQNLIAAEHLK